MIAKIYYGVLSIPDISKWDTTKVFDISEMFTNCIELTSLPDLSKWNTNSLQDAYGLFKL